MFLDSSATISRNSSTVGSIVGVVPPASAPAAAGAVEEGEGGRE
jgi:hypothetical protein